MLPGEYKQDLHVMAISIYGQSRTSFPTGTAAELAEEVGAAVERGWL
jgi:hypothetical protein